MAKAYRTDRLRVASLRAVVAGGPQLRYKPAMAIVAKHLPRSVELADPAATEQLARGIARLLRLGDFVALAGDLGAGKTTFARALIQALCGAETEVPSPTFTLLQIYPAPDFEIWHFDLYRLAQPDDALELGIEDAAAAGAVIVEWPDRLDHLLPANRLTIEFGYADRETSRTARLTGSGDWPERLRELELG